MADTAAGAAPFVPTGADLDALRAAAAGCTGCRLHEDTTQTVFGRGPADARLLFVGEQPGDQEDRMGKPFVGPAGRLLRDAVDEAGIDPTSLYITNAVKHFKHTLRGRRRIHQTPDRVDVLACRPWLLAEMAQLRPEVVVALGATAGQALLGPTFRVTRQRGVLMPWPDSAHRREDFPQADGSARILATIHPSAVLRADDRDTAFKGLVDDLRLVADALAAR
jgi:uracil-DNA glycosylase family protein